MRHIDTVRRQGRARKSAQIAAAEQAFQALLAEFEAQQEPVSA